MNAQAKVLPIANGFYRSRSLPLSIQDCKNVFPHTMEVQGLAQEVLFGAPGLTQRLTTGSASSEANRGGVEMGGLAYFVNGEKLYRVNSDDTTTELGTIYGNGRVSISHNGSKMLLIAEDPTAFPTARGYTYWVDDEDGEFVKEINDPDFWENGNPQLSVYIDGWFIAVTDKKKFIGSSLNDPETWNGLDFSAADADPDPATAPVVLNNTLHIVGTRSIEAFDNQAGLGSDFPFIRNGTFATKGSKAAHSIIEFNSSIFFIGGGKEETPAVWQWSGSGMPERISHEGIDGILGDLSETELSEVFAMAYGQDGFYHVMFVLPTQTLVYEITAGKWHERISRVTWQDSTITFTRNRINCIVQAYGRLMVGDFVDGRIGEMDMDFYDEYGDVIPRRWTTQPFQNYMMGISIPMLELTMESGVGNTDTEDPQVEMTRSFDGKTWTYPLLRDIGGQGEYGIRQIWYQLGWSSRFQTFAFETTAKCKIVVIQLMAKVILLRK